MNLLFVSLIKQGTLVCKWDLNPRSFFENRNVLSS